MCLHQEWLNVLQSLILTFALLPVLHFAGDARIMGQFTNGRGLTWLVWLLAIAVLVINAYLVVQQVGDNGGGSVTVEVIVALAGVAYVAFSASLMSAEAKQLWAWLQARCSRG